MSKQSLSDHPNVIDDYVYQFKKFAYVIWIAWTGNVKAVTRNSYLEKLQKLIVPLTKTLRLHKYYLHLQFTVSEVPWFCKRKIS